ncbi:helix-hairpin-helix domain-containing protein [Mycoavidus sp. HKI]|uniref:ComEA family DNA-binding protein n=1 Tax=Mycoavidus sp. HKI TaxID=2840467 RepID=UPI001CC1578D|nr:helix-hairpin-helix domain-containing protein [Mycoavidus sp. HKI]UAW63684.1 helix-hairpin-helix domain-containing protein [Mycoavidus sp. HKI]
MLKNLLFIVSVLALTSTIVIHPAYAGVDVNSANAATLQSIKGINSVKAETIVKERDQHGAYKDAADLAARVKGLGQRSVAKFQQEGLMIGTAVEPPVPAKPNVTTQSRPAGKK